MPVVNVKVQMFFGLSKWGWNETLYASQNGIGGLNAIVKDVLALASLRRACLASDAELEGVRLTQITLPGVLGATEWLTSNTIPGDNFSASPVIQGQSVDPWDAYMFRLDNLDYTYHRNYFMRGIPRIAYNWSSADITNPTINAVWLAVWKNFVAYLTQTAQNGTGWCLKASQKDPNLNPKQPIHGVELDSRGYFMVNVDENFAADLSRGDEVHVHNVKGPGTRGINGDGYVMNVGPGPDVGFGSVTINRRQKCATGQVVYTSNGTLYRREYFLPVIGFSQAGRFVKRNTGRSFFGTRGRASSPVC